MKPTDCPFLGLEDDSETHHAFPSLRNFCLRARPIEIVSLEHQSSHCLCLDYVRCPVLSASLKAPLPDELRVFEPSQRRNYTGVAITFVVIIILIVVGWRQSWFLARSAAPTPTNTALVSEPAAISTPISTSRIAIPTVLTDAQNTPTLPPNLTPSMYPSLAVTPVPGEYPTIIVENTQTTIPMASETVCTPLPGWVVYIVQPNDSLFNIGLKFGVTVAKLQEVNCMGTSVVIYTGQKLYVPYVATLTPPLSPTYQPTESASPTEIIDLPTNTPEPVPTDTPFLTDTPQPSDTPHPTSTSYPTNTVTPPPLPTDTLPTATLTPPPTETGRR